MENMETWGFVRMHSALVKIGRWKRDGKQGFN